MPLSYESTVILTQLKFYSEHSWIISTITLKNSRDDGKVDQLL